VLWVSLLRAGRHNATVPGAALRWAGARHRHGAQGQYPRGCGRSGRHREATAGAASKDELDADGSGDEEVLVVFIWPISLEPMLALGHRTCPTTMQELWDKALTPNATLRQLIAAWVSRRYTRFKKCSADFHNRAAHLVHGYAAHGLHGGGVAGGPRAHGERHRGKVLRILRQPLPASGAAVLPQHPLQLQRRRHQ
jgi:hypothetical protein